MLSWSVTFSAETRIFELRAETDYHSQSKRVSQVKIPGNFRLIGLSSYKRTVYTKSVGRKVKVCRLLASIFYMQAAKQLWFSHGEVFQASPVAGLTYWNRKMDCDLVTRVMQNVSKLLCAEMLEIAEKRLCSDWCCV